MHYVPNIEFAFSSVEHIMRDVNMGWAIRYTHANVASFFFIFVYARSFNFNFNFNIFFYPFLLRLSILYNKIFIENFLNIFKPSLSDSVLIFNKNYINNESKEKLDENFTQWFTGFSDAEGSFLINIKNNTKVHFVFKITLHIEDIAVLYVIKDKLEVGIVFISGTTCSFMVHSFQSIINVLLPIFDANSLLTHKQLNYRD